MTLPVILLPGSMCDATLFAHQLQAFGEAAQLGDLTRSSSLEAMAEDVLRGAPSMFAIAGLSLGGIVAAELASQAPSRVAGVALLDTNLGLADESQLKTRRRWKQEAQAGGFHEIVSSIDRLTFFPETHRQTIVDMALRLGPEVFVKQNEALMHRRDRRADLAEAEFPVLIACGSQDVLCSPAMHQDLADHLPGAQLEMVEDAGHLSTIDQPEKLTHLLTKWLIMCTTNQQMKGTANEYIKQ